LLGRNVIGAQGAVRRLQRSRLAGLDDAGQTQQEKQAGTGQQLTQGARPEGVRHASFPIQQAPNVGPRKCERLSFVSLAVMTNGYGEFSVFLEDGCPGSTHWPTSTSK